MVNRINILFWITALLLTLIVLLNPLENPTGAVTLDRVGTVSVGIRSFCTINLGDGWNFVSFCANRTNTSINSVLMPINSDIRFILQWNDSSQEFNVYSPLAASPAFTQFNFSKSYFVFMKNSNTLSLTGDEWNNLTISLTEGWNSPVYPYLTERNVSSYLDLSDVRFILQWNHTLQEFEVYSTLAAQNPFSTIERGDGQFVNVIPDESIINYVR